jgi:hypothetical protein
MQLLNFGGEVSPLYRSAPASPPSPLLSECFREQFNKGTPCYETGLISSDQFILAVDNMSDGQDKIYLVFLHSKQGTSDPAVFQVAVSGVSVLLKQAGFSPGSQCQLDSHRLSPLLHALLSSSNSEPALQVLVLRVIARCLVQANSSCSQHRPSIKKWASVAAFHPDLPLAQVCTGEFSLRV